MECPNCHQPTEPGAAFCGNCGQALQSAPPAAPASPIPVAASPSGSPPAGIPAYALPAAGGNTREIQAALSLLLGVAGIIGALFMALLGIALGTSGFVLGTLSRSGKRRDVSTAGLVVSSLALAVSLATWTYAVTQDNAKSKISRTPASAAGSPAVSAAELSTPCYSAGFVSKLNVTNESGSCDMSAFNGATLDQSSEVYKVYASKSVITTSGGFMVTAKPALEKDVKENLPGFAVTSEKVSQFAGSPAYVVNTADRAHHLALVEAAVFHAVNGGGDNVFVLVHAVNGDSVDFGVLEANWQWK